MAIRTKRWTRLEYERLIALGAFGPEDRLELLGGQLVVREPQGRPHATGIRLVAKALRAAFGPQWSIERGEKAGLYARAGVEDYWIVNLADNALEVYRDPEADPDSPYGWRYGSALALSAGDRVRPLSVPNAEILVADLLP